MKKKLLILLSAGLLTFLNISAQYTVTDLGVEVQNGDISLVDFDNDGDLDLVIVGQQNIAQAYKNDGAGNFTPFTMPLIGLSNANVDWGDINNDGQIDLIQDGFITGNDDPQVKVYTSNGAGVFTDQTPANIVNLAPTCGFADLNNDGYTDIYVFGNFFKGSSKILYNDKMGGFTEYAPFENHRFIDPDVTAIDYDNDKDLDLFVNAYDDTVKSRYSKMFVNNNGIFTEMSLNIIEKGFGSAVWADYDGDGDLDLLLNGSGGLLTGEDNDFIYRLYRNDAGTFNEATTITPYAQFGVGDGGRFADWDNDGDLDIIVTGWQGNPARQGTAIYLNTGGVFTEAANNADLPGVSESSIEVADVDGDTDLDLFITGFSGGASGPFNRRIAVMVTNPTNVVNVAPTPPTNLNVTGNAAAITMTWTASTDETSLQTAAGLSYNLFLVDALGKWFYYPLADTATGKLKLQRMGNVNLNLGWMIKDLPAGTYRWGVQAVDNSFMGSTFATSSFSILADGSLPVVLKSFTANPEGKKTRLEWSTASEQNNDRFEVQRSSDGKKFFELATAKGNGTTNRTSNYSTYDNNPSAGTNYYRLIQYNLDGVSTDHGIKIVKFGGDAVSASAIVYPNPAPAAPGIRLSNFAGKQVTVTMTDMMGKLIHKETIQADNSQGYYQLHLKNKPVSGQYILLVSGEGLKETLKVIMK